MKRAYFFLMILFVGFACENQEEAPRTLVGKWEWVSTYGGIAPQNNTPQSTGKSIILELDNNLAYREYVNGVLTSEGRYSLSKEKCIHDNQEKDMISFSGNTIFGGHQQMIERLDNQVLYLSDEFMDGFETHFKPAATSGRGK